ncbi:MAG: helix-turn-helix domain-containing protein [Spirochaetia bacterium]|nr:helix-turn-helix domain-containing protein [Spirochaetia bacterium]
MSLFSNIIAPVVAGLFFLLYFIYFIIANPSRLSSYWYFIVFLVCMSIFSLGRPLQLILGPYPAPLIVVNIRVFLLCGVIAPVTILGSDLFNRRKMEGLAVAVLSIGLLLGLTYVVFNTLGTKSSKTLFHFAGMTAYDNLTPERNPPFYGREVTIAVQVITGALMLLSSSIRLARLKLDSSFRDLLKSKHFLFNGGVSIFAVAFIVGSLTKKWEIYYTVSIFSAILFGWSVLIDVREVYRNYEKLLPFIKEDIIDNVAFSEISKTKLTDMLSCLGKVCPNTIVMIKLEGEGGETLKELKLPDEVIKIATVQLLRAFNEDAFLLLPFTKGRIGIALRLPQGGEAGEKPAMWDILEALQAEIRRNLGRSAVVGIGRSYDRVEYLRKSYHEALNALEYAEHFGNAGIVHVDNISEQDSRINPYPVKEKEKLLSQIRVGDPEASRRAFKEFMEKFTRFVAEKPEALGIRLYELVGSMIDAAILGGGDETKLNELVGSCFDDISHVKDAQTAEQWLLQIVVDIANLVAHVYEKRSKSLMRNAIKYIEENYAQPLSYKDVAKEVFISPSYFLSLFKQETGLTFVDHLTTVRIDKAKLLLATTEKSIAEIAYEVGFNNPNYFSSTFKKLSGMTAKEYRSKD